jgi:hypothetical protein
MGPTARIVWILAGILIAFVVIAYVFSQTLEREEVGLATLVA